MSTKGLVHLYTGEGKGKTTAAIGLAVRGAGAGMQVVFVQLMKGRHTSELSVMSRIPSLRIFRNPVDLGFYCSMPEADKEKMKEMHSRSLDMASRLIREGRCGMLILDEVTSAYEYGLLDRERIKELICAGSGPELVLTGRNPDPFFLSHADYITEMKKVRHPYDFGVAARTGIEM